MEDILNGKVVSMDDLSEELRLLECDIPSLAYIRPTWVKCHTCGERAEFVAPTTAYDFVNRHARKGCKKVEIIVGQVSRC